MKIRKILVAVVVLSLLLCGCSNSTPEKKETQVVNYHGVTLSIPANWEEMEVPELNDVVLYSNIDDSYEVNDDSYELYMSYSEEKEYDEVVKTEKTNLEKSGVSSGIEECDVNGKNALRYEREQEGIHIDEYLIDAPNGVLSISMCAGKNLVDTCHSCIESISFSE